MSTSLDERMATYRDCEVFLPPERLGDFASNLRPLRGHLHEDSNPRL